MRHPPPKTLSLLAAALLAGALSGPVTAAGGPGGGSPSSGSGASEMPGEVLLKLRSGDALPALLSKYSLTLVSRFGARPIYRLKIVGTARLGDVLAQLTLDPAVLIAETNLIQQSPEARRNMPWAIGDPQAVAAQWAPQALNLAQAQTMSVGAGVRVAVLDTGVDGTHPLLAGRMLPGFDFVDYDSDPSEPTIATGSGWGHGTHVAGLVAMVAPGAQIMPLRVLDGNGVGNAWVLAEAMLYAIDPDGDPNTDDGAQIINLSLGSLARTRIVDAVARLAACAPAVADDPVNDRSDPGYSADALRCERHGGTLVVAAAGNDGSASAKQYPAAEGVDSLVSIAASNASKHLAGFSNFGSWIGLAAPGDAITSSLPGGRWGTWGGTSMAAPIVAGSAALLLAREPALTPKDVIDRLRRTASVLCATQLRQVDPLAALTHTVPASSSCK